MGYVDPIFAKMYAHIFANMKMRSIVALAKAFLVSSCNQIKVVPT